MNPYYCLTTAAVLLLAMTSGAQGAAAEHDRQAIEAKLFPAETGDARGGPHRSGVLRRENPDQAPRITLETIQFELDSDVLLPQSLAQLDAVAAVMNASNDRFAIEGHTCALGGVVHNDSLSWRRASAVMRYLEGTRGVNTKDYEVYGFGPRRLLDPVNAENPNNRRVEVVRLESRAQAAPAHRGARMAADREKDASDPCPNRFLCEVRFRGVRDFQTGWDEFYPDDTVTIQAGGSIRAVFKVVEACHVSLIHVNPDGQVAWMAPQTPLASGKFIYPTETGYVYQLPDAPFGMNAAQGRSAVLLIAANGPLPDLDKLNALLARRGADLEPADIVAIHPNPGKGGDAPLEGTGASPFRSDIPFEVEVYARRVAHSAR